MTNDRKKYNYELLENAHKHGLPDPVTTLWIEVSYARFAERSLGIYKASAFQVAAAESERLGFTKSRTLKRHRIPGDPDSPLVDYKEYLLLTDVMQSTLDTGVMPPPVEINSPLLKSIATRKERKKRERAEQRAIEKNTTPPLKSIAPPVEINSNNNITEESTKDTKIDNASSEQPSSIPAPVPDATASATHTSFFDGPGQDQQEPPTPDDSPPTEQSSYSQSPYEVSETMTIGNVHEKRAEDLPPEVPSVCTPVADDEVLKARRRHWYGEMTDWCGGPMETKGEVINEHKAINTLTSRYSDVQLTLLLTYLRERHFKWSKPDFKYTIRASVLLRESTSVAKILKDERVSASSSSQPSAQSPTDQGPVGVSGRLRVVSTGTLTVVPPKRQTRAATSVPVARRA